MARGAIGRSAGRARRIEARSMVGNLQWVEMGEGKEDDGGGRAGLGASEGELRRRARYARKNQDTRDVI